MFLWFNFNFHRLWRVIELVKPSESTLMQRPQKIRATFEPLRWCQVTLLLHLHSLLRNWASRDQQNECIKSTGPKRLINWVSNVSIVIKSKVRRYKYENNFPHIISFVEIHGLECLYRSIGLVYYKHCIKIFFRSGSVINITHNLDWPLVNRWKQEFKTWNMKLYGIKWLDKMTKWLANFRWIMVLEAAHHFGLVRRLQYYCWNLIANGV